MTNDSVPETGSNGCKGVFKNEYIVAAPTSMNNKPTAKQT
jgi:hypothetical protein